MAYKVFSYFDPDMMNVSTGTIFLLNKSQRLCVSMSLKDDINIDVFIVSDEQQELK